MSTHLATLDGILCATPAWAPAKSPDLDFVSCTRCSKALDRETRAGADAAAERRRLEQYRAACESLGIDHLWQRVADAHTPTERLLRDLLGLVAVGFDEMGELL